jgi:hypothetical protein
MDSTTAARRSRDVREFRHCVGAKRLVDALVGGPLESGGFYAGAQQTLTGLLVNQAGIVADFGDDAVQDHAYGAIHAFLRTPSAEEAQP